MNGIGTKRPAKRQHDADDEDAAHDVAEQADHQREGPGDLGQEIERQHDPGRLGEVGEIAAEGRARGRRNMHREEDDERQAGVGFEMRGRRLDAGDSAEEIGETRKMNRVPSNGR